MTGHDYLCESVAVDIGVGELHSPCGCVERARAIERPAVDVAEFEAALDDYRDAASDINQAGFLSRPHAVQPARTRVLALYAAQVARAEKAEADTDRLVGGAVRELRAERDAARKVAATERRGRQKAESALMKLQRQIERTPVTNLRENVPLVNEAAWLRAEHAAMRDMLKNFVDIELVDVKLAALTTKNEG